MKEIFKIYEEMGEWLDLANGFNIDMNSSMAHYHNNLVHFPRLAKQQRHRARRKVVLMQECMYRVSSLASEFTLDKDLVG